ncbi:MAG: hypothetical protein WBM36_05725 [Lysobacterales bacterium]
MLKRSPAKSRTKRKGYLVAGLVIVFVILSGIYFLTTGIRDAKRIEQILVDRFDWAEHYTPSIDGSIDPHRIEAFIRVREAVQSDCAEYQAVLISINRLDELESDKEVSASDAASTGFESFKSIFSAGPRMVSFSTTRNQALLNEDMGLGEYLYIYLTTYGEQLANEPTSSFSGMEEAYISDRARKEFAQILTNQLLALQSSELNPTDPDLERNLELEIEALQDGSHPSPWPNGPLGKARESLAPYQQQLSGLYCSGIVKIELLQKNRGFNLEG